MEQRVNKASGLQLHQYYSDRVAVNETDGDECMGRGDAPPPTPYADNVLHPKLQ
jgi:hypothetical protein